MKATQILTVLASIACIAFAAPTFARDDDAITQEIQAKLKKNQTLAPFNMEIITKDGIVNIKGVVNSDPQAGMVVEIAQATEGVTDVDTSELETKSNKDKHPFDDTLITAKVKGTFLRDKLFTDKDIKAFGIKVKTKNGTVYLSGRTNDQAQIDNAISIARAIKGVKNVESSLKVKAQTN